MKRVSPWFIAISFVMLFGIGIFSSEGMSADSDSSAKRVTNEITYRDPPGGFTTTWVGNTFSGEGGENGFGYWVQNGADEIEVMPDGTVIAGCDWDEAGRCAGLYREGLANRVLLRQEDVPDTAWGWNTGNHAIAFEGNEIYIPNLGKHLLRFRNQTNRTEQSSQLMDLDTWECVEDVLLPAVPVGANARNGILVIAYDDSIELRKTSDLSVIRKWAVPGTVARPVLKDDASEEEKNRKYSTVEDVVFDGVDTLWILANGQIRCFNQKGQETPTRFSGLQKPVSLALDTQNVTTLIVCDDGSDQQVKFFDCGTVATPKLIRTFGERGGLRSQTLVDGKPLVPGMTHSHRLYAPHGAGTDAKGNLYVALGFNGAPVGTLVLRSFSLDGSLRWELQNHAFVDTYGFDPQSDGKRIYSRTAMLAWDPETTVTDATPSRSAWTHLGTTIDHVGDPKDCRIGHAWTAVLKHIDGKRLLAMIGQYGGGYRFFTFDEPNGVIAYRAGQLVAPGETWAWCIDDAGDIWHGDSWVDQKATIRRYRFKGWKQGVGYGEDEQENKLLAQGKQDVNIPVYDTEHFDEWTKPDDFELIRRVIYVKITDSLYISGYLKTDEIDSWGVCGKTIRRYDGWTSGTPRIVWTATMPTNPTGENGKPLSPSGMTIVGDYIFCGMVKPEQRDGKDTQYTHILRCSDGTYVGSFYPSEPVGLCAGWLDMPYSVAGIRRTNGEYLIMVEEDWRGKNMIYRWTPPTN